jgi:hypothetical protein
MKSNRRLYRKHKVSINGNYIPVKVWMRENENYFKQLKGVPTSEQIGTVLIKNGFKRNETEFEVIYTK